MVSAASVAHAQDNRNHYDTTEYYPTGTSYIYTTAPYYTGEATTTGEPFRECGGTITGYETIASPQEWRNPYNNPSPSWYYPANVQCVWNIELGDHVPGFHIVKKFFDIEESRTCQWDWVRITANGVEENYCGHPEIRKAENKEKESGKKTPDQVNPISTGFPASKFIPGGSAVIRMHSDNIVEYRGFEFELVKISRWELIKFHVGRVIDSVADESWGKRYANRMTKNLNKLEGAAPEDGISCYDENIPQGERGEEADEITVFDADNMCKLNSQVNSAINSYARHNACKGRGKVYRQVIRSARKAKKFFHDKDEC